MENANLLTINEYLKRDGRSLMEIVEAVMFEDENAPALCDHGCGVEPDGSCCHGCPSILRAAGVIGEESRGLYCQKTLARVRGSCSRLAPGNWLSTRTLDWCSSPRKRNSNQPDLSGILKF